MTRILSAITTAVAVLTISTSAAPKQNFGPSQPGPVAVINFGPEQARVVDRKAEKYGINPNLLHATLTVELQRLDPKSGSNDPQIFEWMAEQAARVLRHLLEKTDDACSVFKYYAAGGVYADSQTRCYRAAIQFASQADTIFRHLEKERPWSGR